VVGRNGRAPGKTTDRGDRGGNKYTCEMDAQGEGGI
jgi:hypothetical protein